MKLKDIKLNDINNKPIEWDKFDNKALLFVNVASKCGFTPQYEQLQALYDQRDDLEIIALPCNDFGAQEPGSAEEIESFCKINYGVSFTIAEKLSIQKDPHEIIRYLCESGDKKIKIRWNFYKFLVMDGKVTAYFKSMTSPLSKKIKKALEA